MNRVLFTYLNQEYFIQCNNEDKMGNIFSKILNKLGQNNNDIIFLYNGIKVNEELTFDECVSDLDRDNNQMNLIMTKKEPELTNNITTINNNINNNVNPINNNTNNINTVNNVNNDIHNIINNNIDEYYSMKDRYANLDINKIRINLQYQTLNGIDNLFILRDGRIITNQKVYYGDGDDEEDGENKLCVYSIKNNKIKCDINIDYQYSNNCIETSDGNVIMVFSDKIKIIKIHQKYIEEIQNLNLKKAKISVFFYKDNFLIKCLAENQPSKAKGFFADLFYVYDQCLFKYENGNLISYKNLNELYKKEKVKAIAQINSNEYALLSQKKGVVYGTNDYIIFYDMITDKKIKSLKIGNGERYGNLLLLNKENLIVFRDYSLVLIDVKNRKTNKEFKYEMDIYEFTLINETSFLYKQNGKICLYKLDGAHNIVQKGDAELTDSYEQLFRFPGNKLIGFTNNNISLLSFN